MHGAWLAYSAYSSQKTGFRIYCVGQCGCRNKSQHFELAKLSLAASALDTQYSTETFLNLVQWDMDRMDRFPKQQSMYPYEGTHLRAVRDLLWDGDVAQLNIVEHTADIGRPCIHLDPSGHSLEPMGTHLSATYLCSL